MSLWSDSIFGRPDLIALAGAVLIWVLVLVGGAVALYLTQKPEDGTELENEDLEAMRDWVAPLVERGYWWTALAAGVLVGALARSPVLVAIAYIALVECLTWGVTKLPGSVKHSPLINWARILRTAEIVVLASCVMFLLRLVLTT